MKWVLALVAVAAFVWPSRSNVWAADDMAPVREDMVLSDDQVKQLQELSVKRGSKSSKTTFSASEAEEYAVYLSVLFLTEFKRKINSFEFQRGGLSYEELVVASSEDVEGEAKISASAKPFVYILAAKRLSKKMERIVKSYFTDDVDYLFAPLDDSDDPSFIVACNPKTQKWTVWIEFDSFGDDDTDLNFYYLSEGPIFGADFESEKKKQHVMVLKQRLDKERARALRVQRNNEREERAAARNSDRVSRQNATIQGSREAQRRMGRQ